MSVALLALLSPPLPGSFANLNGAGRLGGSFALDGADLSSGGLSGTRWTLSLDVGAERGTWMPPTWGRSGARATPRVRVEFAEDGELRILETGPYDRVTVSWAGAGRWTQPAGREKAEFWLPHTGLARDDVVLEAGRLHFSAPAWGAQLSRRGGTAILDACQVSGFRQARRAIAFWLHAVL